jgi:BASS family bile acid:Na+ symporter
MTGILLPVALGVIMLSLGLSLTIDDFRRALTAPKAVISAMICQMLLMPAICFTLVKIFHLCPAFAVGMMLLAATPGGTLATLYTYLGNGDLALNITLAAINTVLITFTLPLTIGLSLRYFFGFEHFIALPIPKIFASLLIILIPPFIGMYLRHLHPKTAKAMDRPVRIAAVLFLIGISVAILSSEGHNLVHSFPAVGPAIIIFDVVCLGTGYTVALWMRLGRKQAVAISMEVGVHNAALASGIALSPLLLDSPIMAIPAITSGLVSVFIAGLFTIFINLRSE